MTLFLHKSSSWVEIRLHAKNQLPGYPGSGLKVSGGWRGDRPITLSLQLEMCWVELGCDNYDVSAPHMLLYPPGLWLGHILLGGLV